MTNCQKADEILECILPYVEDPTDRAAISVVCRRWYDLDRLTRRHVSINFCYATTPRRLYRRFPNIESVKLKGKPRVAMFDMVQENWGGYAEPWLVVLEKIPRLKLVHFRRMIVSDDDLEKIAAMKGPVLQSLKLDKCSGFTTDGLLHITRSCRNLKTLFLEESTMTEISGEWFHQLSLHNRVLETLNFYMTFLEKIGVEDLEFLARNCPLISVKIGDTDLSQLVNFFASATTLQEFYGGSVREGVANYANIAFPVRLTSVGLMYLEEAQAPILFPFSRLLRKLDLVYTSLTCRGHCELIRRCPNLEVLETTNVISDDGLEAVGSTCKRLKRLRIELGPDEQEFGIEIGVVTHVGLIAVAQGCRDLEYLAVHVTDIANEALEHIGANLKHLNDFRLAMIDKDRTSIDLPLDNGVRALLRGCQNMRRFAFCARHGALTDVGLGYIGKFSRNVKWMLLGYVGETDAGILEFSRGCPSLQKFEIRGHCFKMRTLAIVATQLASLRYLWVEGYRTTNTIALDLQEMDRPYWNVEIFPGGHQYDVDGDNGGRPVKVYPSHILAYYSLVGDRTDRPKFIYTLPLPKLELTESDSTRKLTRTRSKV